jgi:hypothetical protein
MESHRLVLWESRSSLITINTAVYVQKRLGFLNSVIFYLLASNTEQHALPHSSKLYQGIHS